MLDCKNIVVSMNSVPRDLFGKTYSLFCFEAIGGVPIALFLSENNKDFYRLDLRSLALFHTHFHDFIDFLKSIKVVDNPFFPVKFDIEMALGHYGVMIEYLDEFNIQKGE